MSELSSSLLQTIAFFILFVSYFKAIHKSPNLIRHRFGVCDRNTLRLLSGKFIFQTSRICNFNARNGMDTYKAVTVFGDVVIGTFQQNSIPEPITHSQINTHRRIYICQHLLNRSCYFNLLHIPVLCYNLQVTSISFFFLTKKNPDNLSRLFSNSMKMYGQCHYKPLTRFVCHHQLLFNMLLLIAMQIWGLKLIRQNIFLKVLLVQPISQPSG